MPRMRRERRHIIEILTAADGEMTTRQVSDARDWMWSGKIDGTRRLLNLMAKDAQVIKLNPGHTGGIRWRLPESR